MGQSDKHLVEQSIREVLSKPLTAATLSQILFSQEGLFSRLADSKEGRQELVQSPLFKQAQARLMELQRVEAAQAEVAWQAILRTQDESVAPEIRKTGSSLAQEVFHAIATRLRWRALEISLFAQTGYSFEEWLNWEAFAACSAMPRWQVQPKPRYRDLGIEDAKQLADLMVTEGDEAKVVVEIGLIHDRTQSKMRGKLDLDRAKMLLGARPSVTILHIVLLVSRNAESPRSARWYEWLCSTSCWGTDAAWTLRERLAHGGRFVLCGWLVPTAAQVPESEVPVAVAS